MEVKEVKDLKTILPSSKHTFEWYLDNLYRLGFYGIGLEKYQELKNHIESIRDIVNSLPVEEQ